MRTPKLSPAVLWSKCGCCYFHYRLPQHSESHPCSAKTHQASLGRGLCTFSFPAVPYSSSSLISWSSRQSGFADFCLTSASVTKALLWQKQAIFPLSCWELPYVCLVTKCVQLFATTWTRDCQVPLSMGIPQVIILVWDAMSSQPRNWTWVSCITGRFFTSWATQEAPSFLYCKFSIADVMLFSFLWSHHLEICKYGRPMNICIK